MHRLFAVGLACLFIVSFAGVSVLIIITRNGGSISRGPGAMKIPLVKI